VKQYFAKHPEHLAPVLQWLASFGGALATALWITHLGRLPITIGGSAIALAYCAWYALLTVCTMNMKDGHEEYNGALVMIFLISGAICALVTFVFDIPGPVFGCLGAIAGGLLSKFFTRPLWRQR
jgi:hypothetical protein